MCLLQKWLFVTVITVYFYYFIILLFYNLVIITSYYFPYNFQHSPLRKIIKIPYLCLQCWWSWEAQCSCNIVRVYGLALTLLRSLPTWRLMEWTSNLFSSLQLGPLENGAWMIYVLYCRSFVDWLRALCKIGCRSKFLLVFLQKD